MYSNLLFTLIGAELTLILVKRGDINILFKSDNQRDDKEKHFIRRGLKRSLFLEIFLFVPVSALLLFLLMPLSEIITQTANNENKKVALYTMPGCTSYILPFSAIKKIIKEAALDALKKYATIISSDIESTQNSELMQANQPNQGDGKK